METMNRKKRRKVTPPTHRESVALVGGRISAEPSNLDILAIILTNEGVLSHPLGIIINSNDNA
jgi:hypothetical protein